jgi:predicted metal-binding membrane protein
MSAAERRTSATAGVLLLLLAGCAWLVLAGPLAQGMAGMGMGTRAPALFLVIWSVMTVAMMVPATVPVLLLHRLHGERTGAGSLPTIAFLGGYLLVWSAAGLAALALVLVEDFAAGAAHVPTTAMSAAALVVAGAYQLTPIKAACLRACRSPLAVLAEHVPGRRLTHELAGGTRHGSWCLACCWSLMAVLLLLGAMNLVWMAVVTVLFLLEKAHPQGAAIARVAGVLLILLGVAGLAHPELLTTVSGGMPPTAMGGGM